MQEFKWKNKPRLGDEGDVDEPDDVPEQPHHQHLDVAVLGDDLEAVEVGAHLRDVIDHRGDAEYGRVASVVLESKKYFLIDCKKYLTLIKVIDATCRCQKRKVKMRPIPMPITQAVSINIRSRRFVKA